MYNYVPGKGWVPNARLVVDGSELQEGDKVFAYICNGREYRDWPDGHTLKNIRKTGARRSEALVGTLEGYEWEIERA